MTWLNKVFRVLGASFLAGLAAAIAALWLFGWLAKEMLAGETKIFDDAVRSFFHSLASPGLTWLMQFASWLGSTTALVVIGVTFGAAFALANWKRAIGVFAMTMAGATILLNALKFSFRRARPEPYFDTVLPSTYSFPSGHALFALCFFGVLAWLISARIKNGLARVGIWALALCLILLIGISRIYLGVHYPSDVVAGYAAAFVWVFTVALGDFWLKRRAVSKNKNV